MSQHFLILMSFVYAIALTHLFSSAADLIQARERVHFYGAQALWMAVMLVALFNNFLGLVHLNEVKAWTLANEANNFVYGGVQYFTCALVSVRVEPEVPVDMEVAYLKQRRAFLGAATLMGLIVIANDTVARFEDPAWQTHVLLNVPFLVFYAIGAFANPRWLQWLAAAGALGLAVLYMLVFPPMGAG